VSSSPEALLRILIVDDDRNSRESLGRALQRDGYEILSAEDGKVALEMVREHEVDLVLTDLKMPGLDGMDFLEGLRVVRPEVPAILISAYASVDTAVKALRKGVSDVLEKPIRLKDVRRAIKRVVETHRLPGRARMREAGAGGEGPAPLETGRLIGRSPAFLEMLDLVARVAPVNSTALLLGESGTGKELIADAIHAGSPRRGGPLVKVACAALAEGVLEAELFGSEKGAYTGAHALRKGRFELAHGGTLFLDEVGEIPLALQVKLLRVLQEGEFERVGGTETLRTKVRVITATNRDLEREVARGRFREDLYWRLNVIAIRVPPLRDRPEDIPLLAQHFLEKAVRTTGRALPLTFAPDVLPLFSNYRWPGNVREMENAVERAVVLARGNVIAVDDLPEALRRSPGDPALQRRAVIRFEVGQSLETLEREAVRRTLETVGGNREAAASLLGIGLATLYRRLREMGELTDRDAAERDPAEPAPSEPPATGAGT
jgi:DNA-binding NtrC family response regulator